MTIVRRRNCFVTLLLFKDGWQMIKLKSENILSDNLNIFVETKFAETSGNRTEGFWAVDDVRVCHENGNYL
jgi:hypothetical protein